METFDEKKQAALVDMLSHLLKINSVLFINKFEKLKTKELKESFNKTKKELIELFNPEKATLNQLEKLKSTVSGVDDLSSEVSKM